MYYYNNELPPQQGWICPKCGRVNAPWLPTCECVSSQTSGTPYLVKTSSISRDSHEIAKTEPQTEPQTELVNDNQILVKDLVDDEFNPYDEECMRCKHLKLKCEFVPSYCKYEPRDESQTDCKKCKHFATDKCRECYGNEYFEDSGYTTEMASILQTLDLGNGFSITANIADTPQTEQTDCAWK